VPYRRQFKVVRQDESGRDCIDFHSFRRSAIRCLENARVPQSEAAQVLGHERAGITFGTYNPEGMGLKAFAGCGGEDRLQGIGSAGMMIGSPRLRKGPHALTAPLYRRRASHVAASAAS